MKVEKIPMYNMSLKTTCDCVLFLTSKELSIVFNSGLMAALVYGLDLRF
jgi:hypothetical protein